MPVRPSVLARIALLGALPLATLGSRAMAQEWSGNVVVPQSRVIVPPDASNPVRIERVEASVDLREALATTTLRITLRNPSPRQQEAELLLPVPDGSSVRFFQLEGLGGDAGARLLPKEEARRIYESIVRRMRDPAILEFAGMGLVRSNVFPVPAQGTQTIVLTYEQMLTEHDGRLDYVLPRSQSTLEAGASWEISVRVRTDRGIGAIYSPSHELRLPAMRPGDRDASLGVLDAGRGGAFQLSVVPGRGAGGTVVVYPDGDGAGGYFMLLASPPTPPEAPMRREVTLVIDRSGSMRGEKMDQARQAALQVIEGLRDGELFNIIDYSDSVEKFSPGPVVRDAESLRQARAYIEGIRPVGGTNIHDALLAALAQGHEGEALPIVLFLTDGLATVGRTREAEIRDAIARHNVHERRIFSFGVGYDVNAPLLSAISKGSRATSTFVLPEEDVEVKVGAMFRRLNGPVLTSPRLTFASREPDRRAGPPLRDVLPGQLPDVFEGEQIVVTGRYVSDSPVHLTVEGEAGGRAWTRSFEITPASGDVGNAFVARLWAREKIASLIEQIRLAGADEGSVDDPRVKELVDEVVRLSLDFGILTEYTAFLADEREADVALGATRRARENVLDRGLRERAGAGAVSQEMNLARRPAESAGGGAIAPSAQTLYVLTADDKVEAREVLNVQQVGDLALIRQDGRWLDGRLVGRERADADEVVEFASDRYFALADRLVREGRQALLAVRGEVELLLDGKRVLIRAAG